MSGVDWDAVFARYAPLLPRVATRGELHRYLPGECDLDALIVDLRYNRGGHVSQLLLEKVARKRIAWNIARWGHPSSYPDESVAGPVVALTNEHAGADGGIFSHNFKLMGVGTLVAEWLLDRLVEDVLTVVGIDHGFSFPLRYFDDHQLAHD